VILTDTAKLQLFHALAEKESTNDELFTNVYRREQIPDFYKNINVLHSKAYRTIVYSNHSKSTQDLESLKSNFMKFFLEFEEADEPCFYK
jgi:hypothetical protein